MQGFTIGICTYNPEKEVFINTIKSLTDLDKPLGLEYEFIIVDNNSNQKLEEVDYISTFLKTTAFSRIVYEKQAGLTIARLRVIKEAKFDWIIFFDDDNAPVEDYLKNASELVLNFPFVAAWNAAIINVQYLGKVNGWFRTKGISHFQESNFRRTIYGNDDNSFRHWPFGTGLILKKDAALLYTEKVRTNIYSLSDRKGGSLSSGGDGQMVACALELGYAVGRAIELKLQHIISTRKSNLDYLKKQEYGISYSDQMFLKETVPAGFKSISTLKGFFVMAKCIFFDNIYKYIRYGKENVLLSTCGLIGKFAGNFESQGIKRPFWLNPIAKMFGVKN